MHRVDPARSTGVGIDHLPVPACTLDPDGVVVEVNQALLQLVGRSPVGSSLAELVGPSASNLLRAARRNEAPGASVLARVTGVDVPVRLSVVPTNHSGAVVAYLVPTSMESEIAADPTLRAHQVLGHGVVIGDGSRVLHVSDAAALIFGRPPEELLEIGSLFGLFEEGEQNRIRDLIAARQAADEPIPEHFETMVRRPDGALLPVELWVKAVADDNGVHTYTLISDASERQRRQRELAYMATHDHLTGLPNRYLLLDRLNTAIRQLARKPGSVSLAFIDLDRFKAVNDDLGHSAGDAVLQAMADRLRSSSRSCDTVARLGGDEFVVLCGDASAHDDPEVLRQRLGRSLAEPICGDGWTVEVTASIGTVVVTDDSVDAETLLAQADLAMYDVKRSNPDGPPGGAPAA